jgi:GNAT superfamily N-acetyltransferase
MIEPPSPARTNLVPLDETHAPHLQSVCEACHDFYRETTGLPPGLAETDKFLADVPPHGDRSQKRVWVIFYQTTLIGIVDCAFGHPAPGDFWIGLLLLHPEWRGQGLGGDIVRALVAYAQRHDAPRIGIAVKADFRAAHLFWRRRGFVPIARQLSTLPGLGPTMFDMMVHSLIERAEM